MTQTATVDEVMRTLADPTFAIGCFLSFVLGIGLAAAIAPLVTTVMGAPDPDDVGAASGINNSISRVGNLVAIAVLGIVIAAAGGGPLPTVSHPEGFRDAMLGAGALALAAAIAACFLPPAAAPNRKS